ncbi:MAG: OmpA family protein [Chloroflexi bacterium]|nr:OmpA family protein [Chloroflexota bacterium]
MSHGGGSERWLVSYADFITLLMVLFVVLYSMGQVDIERYKQLAEGLRAAFSGGPVSIVDPGITQSTGVDEDTSAAPIVIPGIPQVPVDSVEVAGELTDMLAAADLGGSVSVQNNIEGVLISLSEKLLFSAGTAEMNPEAYPVLDTIVRMIQPLENDIRIIGHTDDSAPLDPRYPTNWELSAARAIVVSNYFQMAGIDPSRLTVSGRGDTKPLFPNDTSEHRALNSRAEIIVVYSVGSDVMNLDVNPASGGPTLP